MRSDGQQGKESWGRLALTSDGRVAEADDGAATVTGLAPGTLIGRAWDTILRPQAGEASPLAQVLDGQAPVAAGDMVSANGIPLAVTACAGPDGTIEVRLRDLAPASLWRVEHDLVNGLLATSVSAVLVLDPARHVLFANGRAEAVLRLTRDADNVVTLCPLRLFRAGIELDQADWPSERARRTGTAVQEEDLEVLWPDGSRRRLAVAAAPIVGKRFPPDVAVAVEDVTERAETAALQRQLVEILEASPDFVSMADMDRNVRYLSAGARRLAGLPPSAPGALGFDIPPGLAAAGRYVHPDWASRRIIAEGIPTALAKGVWEGESALIDAEGTEIPVAQIILCHRDDQGRPLRLSTIMHDIRHLRRMEASLKRSNQDLQQFAHVVSHDLQEPLRMVSAYLDLLARRYQGRLDADADEFIGYAVDGARRMNRMILDLLDYSRVESRGGDLVPTDLDEALDGALKNLQRLITENGAEIDRQPLPMVTADGVQIGRVFQNLITNALRYRDTDRTPVIAITAETVAGRIAVSVADNGIGIVPEDQERIFAVFQRGRDRRGEGSGIGLSICKRIVERHGGTLTVESRPGAGTTFRFTLPPAS